MNCAEYVCVTGIAAGSLQACCRPVIGLLQARYRLAACMNVVSSLLVTIVQGKFVASLRLF